MRRRGTLELGPWPFSERPRVLIEHHEPAVGLELAAAFRSAGFGVAVCHGPDASARCPLDAFEPCVVVEGADAVVTALDFERPDARAVLAGLRIRYPRTPLVVCATAADSIELADELHGCIVLPVDAEPSRVVGAVRAEVGTASK